MSGSEQTRKSWRYPGDKLNRNLLGRTSELSTGRHRATPNARAALYATHLTGRVAGYAFTRHFKKNAILSKN